MGRRTGRSPGRRGRERARRQRTLLSRPKRWRWTMASSGNGFYEVTPSTGCGRRTAPTRRWSPGRRTPPTGRWSGVGGAICAASLHRPTTLASTRRWRGTRTRINTCASHRRGRCCTTCRSSCTPQATRCWRSTRRGRAWRWATRFRRAGSVSRAFGRGGTRTAPIAPISGRSRAGRSRRAGRGMAAR